MIILGIDPGTTRIGVGIIKKEDGRLSYLFGGILPISEGISGAKRLLEIERGIENVFKKYKPDRAGIEKLFFSKNKKTAMSVAEARGVMLKALEKSGIETYELSPIEVKIALTGNGMSGKGGVSNMVKKILSINTRGFLDDTTDALAISIAVSGNHPEIDFSRT